MTTSLPESVDVVVVGSGPCGATYARILSEQSPDATVLVLEVGPLLAEPPGVHVKNLVDDEERARAARRSEGPNPKSGDADSGYLSDDPRRSRPGTFLLPHGYQMPGEDGLPAAAMSSNVGGMGAHWTCACPRPGESEIIPFVPSMDHLLAEAERLLSVSSEALRDAPFAADVRSRLSSVFDAGRTSARRVAPMPLAVVRHDDGRLTWSGADVVFGEATRANRNVTLEPETLATSVLVTDGRVSGVRTRDMRSGGEHTVDARFVVVAADSLRTPQLLWASGVRPRALGRYLNDQTQAVLAVRLKQVPHDPELTVDPRRVHGEIVGQGGVSWVPYTDLEPFHGQVMQLDASPVPLAADDVPEPGTIVGLGWFSAKDLQESDRVEFDDSRTDAYGMPEMQIHYRLTDRDHATLDLARAALLRAAHALGEPLGDEPLTFPLGTSVHYQGTVRMGEHDDGTSVCSPTSRVWDVDGLYVAGNGVIPTATACNPTLTSVALAVAGARDIAARLGTDRPARPADPTPFRPEQRTET